MWDTGRKAKCVGMESTGNSTCVALIAEKRAGLMHSHTVPLQSLCIPVCSFLIAFQTCDYSYLGLFSALIFWWIVHYSTHTVFCC